MISFVFESVHAVSRRKNMGEGGGGAPSRNNWIKGVHLLLKVVRSSISKPTVLPAKDDSDVMFCLQSYQGLVLDRSLCINPICRINAQVSYRFALAQVMRTS